MDAGKDHKKGLWTEEEDGILIDYVRVHGKGRWNRLAKMTSLKRSGKSCRLRWINYLSPHVKLGDFSEEEDDLIIRLHNLLGNRWSLIAGRVPGRTDNQVKNHWNTYLSKKRFSATKGKGGSTGSRQKKNVQKTVSGSDVPSKSVLECIFNCGVESNGDERIKSFGEESTRDDFESSNIWLSGEYIDLHAAYEMDPFSVDSNVDFSMFFL